ncbi:glutathione s-transferase [Fusarium avenaceum]|nr:glutathione s-transferase [Fusarium avenaceum]
MSESIIYHYLDLGRLGRGEVVKSVSNEYPLFLRDIGLDFETVRYPYDDTWPATKEKLRKDGLSPTGLLPIIEYKGTKLSQHIPILRYLSREHGGYDGDTSYEKYIVDRVADLYNDWRTAWVASLGGASDDYKNKTVPQYYALVGKYYAESKGPYLLGDKISYTDFAVFQSIDNERRTKTLPDNLPESLQKLVNAMNERPNIAAFIKETA